MICKCRFCGDEFEVLKRGRASTDVCHKEECKKKRAVEVQRNYLKRKRKMNQETVATHLTDEEDECIKYIPMKVDEIRETSIEEVDKNECIDEIVCQTDESDDGFGDIIEIAREIGTLRYQLVTKAIKIQDELKNVDQIEQDLLHMLENVEKLTRGDAVRTSVLIKQNRNKRRGIKNRKFLLSSLINGLTIKNPEMFVRKGIEMVRNNSYNYRVLEEFMTKNKEEEEEVE